MQGAFQAVADVPVLSLGASPAQPTNHYMLQVWEAPMFEAIYVRPRDTSLSMPPHVSVACPVLQHVQEWGTVKISPARSV
jgi:hypothetical protein